MLTVFYFLLSDAPELVTQLYNEGDQYLLRNSPDIFALGFQEIVPLTAQQNVHTDPEKK